MVDLFLLWFWMQLFGKSFFATVALHGWAFSIVMMPWFLSLVLCWAYIYICPQDDILPKLMTSTGSYEDLFRKEISKYDHICEDIAQNIEAQEQLLLQIQVYFLFNLSWTFIYMFLQYHFFYLFWIFKRAIFYIVVERDKV